MKKKLLVSLLAGCMVFMMTGCGSVMEVMQQGQKEESQVEVEAENKEEEKKETEDKETKEEKESENKEQKEETRESKQEEQKEEEKPKANNPVLGDSDIEDYEGFEYLYCETLMTESEKNQETGKMENKELQVFIPQDDYVTVNRYYASGSTLGVHYRFELNPYLSYNADDYLLSENLDMYLENMYDPFYMRDCYDIQRGEAEEIDENTARAAVEYCTYNEYEEEYSSIFATYYLIEVEEDLQIMLEIKVYADETTGKTPMLMEELEAFYEIEINWDEQRAEEKVTNLLANGGNRMVSTGYMIFELPEGWAQDYDNSGYDSLYFAPNGKMNSSDSIICFTESYVGYGNDIPMETLVKDLDATKASLEESLECDISKIEGEVVDTCMGESAKMTFTATVEDGDSADFAIYYAYDSSYLYAFMASVKDGADEDGIAILENILATAQVRD